MSREAWIAVAVIGGIVALVTAYGAFRLGKRLLVTRRMLGELGVGGKIAFYGAIIYTILPVDLLPDPIYLDDMGVLAAGLLYLGHLLRKRGGLKGALPQRRSAPGTTVTPTDRTS